MLSRALTRVMIIITGYAYEKLLLKRRNQSDRKRWMVRSACDGSHHQFKYPIKPGKTTVKHPQKDIPQKTLKRIELQSGVKFD